MNPAGEFHNEEEIIRYGDEKRKRRDSTEGNKDGTERKTYKARIGVGK